MAGRSRRQPRTNVAAEAMRRRFGFESGAKLAVADDEQDEAGPPLGDLPRDAQRRD